MSWRIDWCLLAAGLIGLGLIAVQRQRSEVFALLSEDGEGAGLLNGNAFILIPICLLLAFFGRLGWRIATKTWK